MDFFSPLIWASFGSAFVYCFIMSVTPGPNNILLANAGLNFGYKKTAKLLVGIVVGINLLLMISILGFSHLFNTYKVIHIAISVIGVCFLVYLGLKMALSKSTLKDKQSSDEVRKPMSVFTMFILQFSNVKTIMVMISITSIYHKPTMFDTYIFLSVIMLISNVVAGKVWIIFGSVLSKFLTNPRNGKIFNIVMGSILVIYSILLLPIADIKAIFI